MKAAGFSLIEMLIAMAICGVLMLGAARLLPHLQGQNLQLLTRLRLEEELQQLMMTLEKAVRRAGYCNGQCHGEGLQIAASGQCLLIKWDENSNGRWEDGTHAESEFYGYRWRNDSLEMQRGVSSCEGGGWESLSDPRVVIVSFFHAERDNRTVRLRLSGHARANTQHSVTIEQWVNGINL